ncbi:MAG: hypothetical protein KJ069_27445 [Anaerolineae bacterium]|nr:hypothetical protein [Anaerolineae bacterium]
MTVYNSPPWRQLLSPLRLPPTGQLPAEACQRCRESLPLFVSDEMVGQAVDDLYPETAVHLDLCPTCFQEYEALAGLAYAALYDLGGNA